MNFLNKIVSPFLKKLDQYLLLNHRLIWETKFHFVLFYGIAAFLGLTGLAYLYPISLASSLPNPTVMGLIAGVPALILFCLWAFSQSRYAIERDFGRLTKGLGQWRFLIYFCTVMLFVLPPLQFGRLAKERIANLVSEHRLQKDIEQLNTGNVYFITDDVYYHDRYSSSKYQGDIYEYLNCRSGQLTCAKYDFHYFGGNTRGYVFKEYNAQDQTDHYSMRRFFNRVDKPIVDQKLNQIRSYIICIPANRGFVNK